MKSSKLMRATLVGAIFLNSNGAFTQTENPVLAKGRWGLNTGLNLDSYKTDISLRHYNNRFAGLLPMVTYTRGKNQFELGPQFLLAQANTRDIHRYFGMNLNYKRYFNGFGTRFVPYLFSGIGFSTTSSSTVQHDGDLSFSRYPYNYQQTGVNLSIGYGVEWQIGKHFYLGSAVGFNPGVYSIRKSDFMTGPSDLWGGMSSQVAKETVGRLDFNVNMQLGYRFGK